MPLVSAERLHRWKCPYCGSKEKNITHLSMDNSKILLKQSTCECKKKEIPRKYDAVKIVVCSRCGHVEFFAHSAIAMAAAIMNQNVTIEESETFVHKFHHWNFDDPMKNPHAAHDTTKQHNPGIVKPNNGK